MIRYEGKDLDPPTCWREMRATSLGALLVKFAGYNPSGRTGPVLVMIAFISARLQKETRVGRGLR